MAQAIKFSTGILKNFYEFPDIFISDNFKSKCITCSRAISTSIKSRTNLITHLKLKHAEQHELYLQGLEVAKKTEPKSSCLDPTPDDRIRKPIPKNNKQVKKLKANNCNQKHPLECLISFITQQMIPLSIIDSAEFREFVERLEPRFQVPSRKDLSSQLLRQRSSQITEILKKQLSQAPSVCLTVDLWSSQQMKSFMGVTVHYMTGNAEWTLQRAMLSCKRFKALLTAENTLSLYEELIKEYEITNKIVCVVTDNASNLINPFRLVGEEDLIDDMEAEDEEDGEYYESDNEWEEVDADYQLAYPTLKFDHLTCYCHSLQLCVKDAMNQCGQGFKSAIGRANDFLTHVKTSVLSSELLEDENIKRLQTANIARWNSQIIAFHTLLEVPHQKIEKYNLSGKDRQVLGELVEILSPFVATTDRLQRGSSTGSTVILQTKLLQSDLEELKDKYNTHTLLQSLISSTNCRLKKYLVSETFILAAAMDPRYKLAWTNDTDYKTYTDLIIEKLSSTLKMDSTNSTANGDDDIEPEDASPVRKENKPSSPADKCTRSELFRRMQTRKVPEEDPGRLVASYLKEPLQPEESDPMIYWKTSGNPLLAQLATRYLVVLASSAPVECLFSSAGKIFRPERCKLTDKAFETLINIRSNSHLLK